MKIKLKEMTNSFGYTDNELSHVAYCCEDMETEWKEDSLLLSPNEYLMYYNHHIYENYEYLDERTVYIRFCPFCGTKIEVNKEK